MHTFENLSSNFIYMSRSIYLEEEKEKMIFKFFPIINTLEKKFKFCEI